MKNARLWRDAAELPDREDETEIEVFTEWSHCSEHGKYPTEATEIIGEGLRICPLCYAELTNKEDTP